MSGHARRRRTASPSAAADLPPMTEREARAALFRFGMHGTDEDEAARAWSTRAERIAADFAERPSTSTARAVAAFSDDEALAALAAEWVEWDESRPDPRGLLEEETAADVSAALDAHTAAEPEPNRSRARRKVRR